MFYWQLSQGGNIDEMSIAFKGRHKCKCYNPNKPHKWHFKAFCLNDSSCGYLWNVYLYRGAAEVREHNISATMYPVIKLTEPLKSVANIKNYHYIFATDNWYTSIAVAVYLFITLGIYLIGTIKKNRQGIPKHSLLKKKEAARGDLNCYSAVYNGTPLFFWIKKKKERGGMQHSNAAF